MEKPSQVKAYAEADFGSGDKDLIIRLKKFIADIGRNHDSITRIIDLGCGPGNISERLALQWPEAEVLGVDGSKTMVEMARFRKKQHQMKSESLKGLKYFLADIALIPKNTSLIKGPFDVVVSNSLIHHIHRPEIFWEAVKCLSSPGTIIFHKDLRRPASMKEAFELQRKYLPKAPEILVKDFLASLQAAFTCKEISFQLRMAGLDKVKVIEQEERYLQINGIF